MTQAIVTYLNAVIDTVGRVDERYCMAELRSDGTTTVPYIYVGNGKVKPISIDGGSLSYWRISGAVPPMEQIASQYGKPRLSATYPLRLVIIARRKDSTVDDGFMPTRLAEDIANALTGSHPDLKTLLKANTVSVSAGYDVNITSVWADEFKGTGVNDPNYTRTIMALSVSVTVVGDRACWENECDYDPDILHLFDFCQAGTVARLTPEQVTCLQAELCDPCADATVTVNTAPFGTAPSGGALNVPVVNGGDNPVGSIVAGEVVIGNNATFINATQVTDQEAEVDANIFVTLDGTQSGTWNAGIQTWEVTSAASGSVSVTVSDATPDFGQTITITATPTGFAPTSYLFFAFDGSSLEFITEQAGAVANWSVTLLGAFDIYVLGTDGSIEVYSTVSAISTGDPDASAFILAAGITDNTEKSAVTTLTLALKSASLYTKFIAVYPLVGGTANSHKYNLIDPQDTDLAHRLTFSGGWTHTSNGAMGNGSNTFADTHIIPNALLTSASNSVGFYSRSNVSENTYDFCCSTDASALYNPFGVISWYNSGSAAYYMSGNYNLSAAVSSASGLTHGFGNSGTWRLYRNGAQIGSTASSSITLPNFALYLGGNNGGGTLNYVSSREYAFAFVANQQMTPTDAVNLYAIIQAYQTTLNRQV